MVARQLLEASLAIKARALFPASLAVCRDTGTCPPALCHFFWSFARRAGTPSSPPCLLYTSPSPRD
eukprot:12667010-Alexandrium_andersonii.AAC.1